MMRIALQFFLAPWCIHACFLEIIFPWNYFPRSVELDDISRTYIVYCRYIRHTLPLAASNEMMNLETAAFEPLISFCVHHPASSKNDSTFKSLFCVLDAASFRRWLDARTFVLCARCCIIELKNYSTPEHYSSVLWMVLNLYRSIRKSVWFARSESCACVFSRRTVLPYQRDGHVYVRLSAYRWEADKDEAKRRKPLVPHQALFFKVRIRSVPIKSLRIWWCGAL